MFDIVIWGATGFTGRLVATYFATQVAKRYPHVTCALAGRDINKLESIRDMFMEAASDAGTGAASPGLLVGDSTKQESVDSVVQQGRVLIAVAGPFINYGTPVVDACVRYGRDYVDITGEVPWVRQIIDKYGDNAAQKGVSIVNMCGFDSVPSDIGTLLVVDELKRRYGQETVEAHGFFTMKGQLSGGTMASGIEMEKRGLFEQLKNPFLLGGGPPDGAVRPAEADVVAPAYSELAGSWTGPFMMAGINTRVVRRSQSLLGSTTGYSSSFLYNEVQAVKDENVAKKLARPMPDYKKRQALVEAGALPKPGEGPTAEQRAMASFDTTVIGRGADGTLVASTVAGGDPGYDETAKMVSEAALHLLESKGDKVAGVVTPATALGLKYADRLQKAGLRCEVNQELTTQLQAGKSKL